MCVCACACACVCVCVCVYIDTNIFILILSFFSYALTFLISPPQLMSSHPFLRPSSELTTRFCFVCFDGSEVLRALRTLPATSAPLQEEFIRDHCPTIVNGVERLRNWVVKHS